ncbi:MAG: hypothetical protein HOV79_25240 [Hamadaea sp.]|nr:hypothetical protein [Hamadaea sp.]
MTLDLNAVPRTGLRAFAVTLVMDEDLLVRHVAGTDPGVLRAIGDAAGHGGRLRLAEAVAAAIDERTRAHLARIDRVLTPLAVRSCPSPAAATVRFLVDRMRRAAFLDAVAMLEAGFWPQFLLRVTGPLPPYSFIDPDRWSIGSILSGTFPRLAPAAPDDSLR